MYTAIWQLANHRKRKTAKLCHNGTNYYEDGAEASACVLFHYKENFWLCNQFMEIRHYSIFKTIITTIENIWNKIFNIITKQPKIIHYHVAYYIVLQLYKYDSSVWFWLEHRDQPVLQGNRSGLEYQLEINTPKGWKLPLFPLTWHR